MRLIIGVSGASGSIYGYRLLERLRRQPTVETHLILTRSAERTAFLESGHTADQFKAIAGHNYPLEDIGSRLASGSFQYARDGDRAVLHSQHVGNCGWSQFKSAHPRRRCVPQGTAQADSHGEREPLALGTLAHHGGAYGNGRTHLAARSRFYNQPKTILDIVDHSVDRVLDLLGLPGPDVKRWDGGKRAPGKGQRHSGKA